MGGENPLDEIDQSKKGGKPAPEGALQAERAKEPMRVPPSRETGNNTAVESLPAFALPSAAVKPGQVPERAGPVIKKEVDGKVTVVGEAEIISMGNETRITRLDKPGNIEIKRTADGGIAYRHTGPNKSDNYECNISPDGKGGNNIDWHRSDGTDKLQYHWSPSNVLMAPGKQTPGLDGKSGGGGHSAQNSESPFQLDNTSTAYAPAPVDIEGDVITDDGKGTRVCRRDGAEGGDERSIISAVCLDSQQNKIVIGDDGFINIQNSRTGAQYDFEPQDNGYKMNLLGVTADSIVSQNLADGVKSTSYNNDLTVIEKPDGSVDKIKSDSLNNTKTAWLADGTVDIMKTNGDGSISQWTYFSDYPKGAFLNAELKPNGECKLRDGSNDPEINAAVQKATKEKFDELRKKYEIYISADADQNVEWGDGTSSAVRTPTLKELTILEQALEKCAVNKEKDMYFTFLKDKNSNSDRYIGSYNQGATYINPHGLYPEHYLNNLTGRFIAVNSLERVLDHELSHHSTRRRDIKAFDSGIASHILAEKYGFKLMEDVAQHKKRWVMEGQESVNGVNQKFLYAKSEDKQTVLRFNMAGQSVSKEGKVVKVNDPEDRINIGEVANVKLPSDYAYQNPREADAELLTFYRHSEQTKIDLLTHDKRHGTAFYAMMENNDQVEIDRFKPADKDSPNGYMRIPSGKIVPKTPHNEKLVLDFMRKHANK